MRTVIVTGIGLAVLAAIIRLAPLGVGLFIPAWFLFCVIDWYVGVYRRGYPAMEELRIHAVIFAVPVAAVFLFVVWANAKR